MTLNYQQIVFAGGGNRCVWQAGFYQVIASELAAPPENISAVSAGAAMSCLIFAGKVEEGLNYFKKVTAENQKNAYFSRIFSKQPVFPHAPIYRQTLLDLIDQDALETLHQGPKIHVQVSRLPQRLGQKTALLLGGIAFSLEQIKGDQQLHSGLGERLGFSKEVYRIDQCQTPEALADLVLASSCTPPFTPALHYQQKPVLDGGMVDSVPVHILPTEFNTLVLLTKQYPNLPHSKTRHYVQPSQPIPIEKWDYTNPQGLQAAFELGLRDAEQFLKQQQPSIII